MIFAARAGVGVGTITDFVNTLLPERRNRMAFDELCAFGGSL